MGTGEKVFETDRLICFKDYLKVILFTLKMDLKLLYTAYSCHQVLKIFSAPPVSTALLQFALDLFFACFFLCDGRRPKRPKSTMAFSV